MDCSKLHTYASYTIRMSSLFGSLMETSVKSFNSAICISSRFE
ncbi:hypothetical protein VCHA29O37_140066 [Vibrio chagasii]|nr:hypothetical protein VCHA29O37_140066 [Vibrio chagasii]